MYDWILFLFTARSVVGLCRRLYNADTTPKITTHYTIVPRETDPRWKGTATGVKGLNRVFPPASAAAAKNRAPEALDLSHPLNIVLFRGGGAAFQV